MNIRKLKSRLVLLYPRAWRDRYGDEFATLLEESLQSPLDVLDVFLGALDAHLQLLSGENLNWRTINMMNKLRTALLVVFTGLVGMAIAGMGLVGIADDSPMIPLMQTNLPLHLSWLAVQGGAVVALLSIIVGGFPLGLTVLHQVFSKGSKKWQLLLVPLAFAVIVIAYLAFIVMVGKGVIHVTGITPVVQPGVFPQGTRLMLEGFIVVVVLSAAISTWAVWKLVSDLGDEPEMQNVGGKTPNTHIYKFAYIPSRIASLAMLVVLLGALVWGWISFNAFPEVYFGNFGPWLTSTRAWYYMIIVLMTASTVAAFLAVSRGRKAMLKI